MTIDSLRRSDKITRIALRVLVAYAAVFLFFRFVVYHRHEPIAFSVLGFCLAGICLLILSRNLRLIRQVPEKRTDSNEQLHGN